MPSKIETELRSRCASTENFRLLLAQWEYDRLLLGQALTTVGHAFPHYSLHDASHSETILERIAALLGPATLLHLSATDLWLLLEAAYLHDSGMVVLEATRRKDLASTEFESHLKATAAGEDHDLAARAKRLLANSHLPQDRLGMLEGHLDLLLVYAEFVRKHHARRAEAIALAPLETTRIDSPRNLLLPIRFWYIVGRICRAHGEDREFVLRELPFEESGVDGELCHPRFVACMLRLGDLLDLDSGRFCPTINATIPQLPSLSEAHRGKHAGIRHLLVCPSRIEVSGVYTDLNAYLEAERWFAWLRDELSAQLVRWAEIAPSHFGSLPSVGRIEAHLEGQITLEAAARPRFEVDREQMIALVQGANIYSGPEDSVREIIQNAIDATLLRYSYESQSRSYLPPKDLEKLRESLEKYPIAVSLERGSEIAGAPDKVEWVLKVEDQGIGIRLEDAKYMLTLGSSKRSSYRRALKEWLPEWARPSGTFGIGFHSIFLYCHKVYIASRHPDDPHGLELTFATQSEATEPTVIIRRRGRPGGQITFAPQIGTRVEARFLVDRFPPSPRYRHRQNWGVSTFARYDFVLDAEIPLAPSAISELAYDMASTSLCTLAPLVLPVPPSSRQQTRTGLLYHFDPEECAEVRVRDFDLWSPEIDLEYRGAPTSGVLRVPPFKGEMDLHASDAVSILELSRNSLTAAGVRIASERLRNILRKVVPVWLVKLRQSEIDDYSSSISYLSLYALLNDIQGHGEEWKSISIAETNLGSIADADAVSFEQLRSSDGKPLVTAVGREFSIKMVGSGWLAAFLAKFFQSRQLESAEGGLRRYQLTKDGAGEDVADEALFALLGPLRPYYSTPSRRAVLPCPRRFAGLAFDRTGLGGESMFGPDPFIKLVLASPFRCSEVDLGGSYIVDVPNIEGYVSWLAKRRSDSEPRIAEKLLELILHLDQLMQHEWREAKRYNLAQVERDLLEIIQPTGV